MADSNSKTTSNRRLFNSPAKPRIKGKFPRKLLITGVCLALIMLIGCSSWHHEDTPGTAFSSPIEFYQGPLNHLHAVREGSCPMHPSCSTYAQEAFEKHGPMIGWAMTYDRVLRCGRNETGITRQVNINGSMRHYDPIHNNDFWWYKDDSTDS